MKALQTTQHNSLIICLGENKHLPIESIQQGRELVNHLSSRIGSTKYYSHKDVGKIFHHETGEIAHISYNGRVWDNNNKEIILN